MKKAPIRYGDTSTHDGHDNGKVVTATSTLIIGGKAAVLSGDCVDATKTRAPHRVRCIHRCALRAG